MATGRAVAISSVIANGRRQAGERSMPKPPAGGPTKVATSHMTANNVLATARSAPRHVAAQQFLHLLELVVVVGFQRHFLVRALEGTIAGVSCQRAQSSERPRRTGFDPLLTWV